MKTKINAMKQGLVTAVAFLSTMLMASVATAATAPTSTTTLGYQIYDIFFNDIYGSGGGYAAGVLMLFWAATKIKGDWREAAYIGGGATMVLAIPTIATALGSTVI